jgi:hypothetical protein
MICFQFFSAKHTFLMEVGRFILTEKKLTSIVLRVRALRKANWTH